MSYNLENLQKQFNLSEEDVKNTLLACGLSLKKKSYNDTEIETKFTQIRQYFSSNRVQNYDEAAALYKSEGLKSKSIKKHQAVEDLTKAFDQLGTDDAEVILSLLTAKGKKRAAQVEHAYDVLLLQKLREKISNGGLLRQLKEEMGKSQEEEDDIDFLEVMEARNQGQITGTPSTHRLLGS